MQAFVNERVQKLLTVEVLGDHDLGELFVNIGVIAGAKSFPLGDRVGRCKDNPIGVCPELDEHR